MASLSGVFVNGFCYRVSCRNTSGPPRGVGSSDTTLGVVVPLGRLKNCSHAAISLKDVFFARYSPSVGLQARWSVFCLDLRGNATFSRTCLCVYIRYDRTVRVHSDLLACVGSSEMKDRHPEDELNLEE